MSSTPLSAIAGRVACVLLLPALGIAIYASERLSVADAYFRAGTPESVATAVRLESGNAAYHQLYAEQLESAGANPLREREIAALLSPLDSHYWIDLAVSSEAQSDFSAAERYYLKAASVDRTFAPRWALMNFYFRRHEETPFWKWTREALSMVYDDASGIYRLCWLMTSDADSIRRLIPQTGTLPAQYLEFLINEGHWEATAPVAREIAQRATPEDMNTLFDYFGRGMIRNTPSVVEAWNILCRRKIQAFAPLAPRDSVLITNGDFQVAPTERGFDWHLPVADGVSVTLSAAASSPGINVELTGEQATAVTVLNQWIPVEPERAYRLEYRYSGDNDTGATGKGPSGLAWEIENPVTGAVIARSQDLDPSARNTTGHLDFAVPGMNVAMLSLRYERAPGTVRHAERFTIHKVSSREP